MSMTKLSVNKPVTILILFVILTGLGLYTTFFIPIDLYPDLNFPALFVITTYEGAGPEEVEKSVTRLLESALSNVGNIDKMTSTSSEGSSIITLSFKWGTDISEATNSVRDRIEYIKSALPDNITTPQIFKLDPSMMPIMYLTLKGNRSPEELRKIAEDIVQPRLEQVEGVSMASVNGGRERIIRVEIPQNRLEAYNLTLTQISAMIASQNTQISAGQITEGNKNILIRTAGEYKNINEIQNTVVAYKTASNRSVNAIKLRDIANVFDGLKKEEMASYVDGQPAVMLVVQKQSGTNSVKTADNVINRLFNEKKSRGFFRNILKNFGIDMPVKPRSGSLIYELPQDLKLEIIYDTTTMIRRSLSSVSQTALSGAFLAVIILFFFLRSVKSVAIIGLSIPISVVITLLLMYFFDFTLNIMTLAGLALGIGMLVDNSIVILDNIYRYREKGSSIKTASLLGSQEMVTAIMASTLTTICVFAPLLMFKKELGIYGALFNGLSFTVVFSLTASIFVAVFLVPALTSRFLPITSRLEQNLTGRLKIFDEFAEKYIGILENKYKNALNYVLNHRKKTIIIISAIFIFTIAFLIINPSFELFPKSENDNVQIKVELPLGTKLDITRNTSLQFEEIIKKEIKDYKNLILNVGERSFFGFMGSVQSHKGTIMIILDDKSALKSTQIQDILRKYFKDFPSAKFTFSSGGGRMMSSSSPIDILVKSDDLVLAKKTADKIVELMKKNVPEVTEIEIDMQEGVPQVEIIIDRKKAYSLGLNIYSIGTEIQANINGRTASQYRESGNDYDILVISEEKDRDETPDLEKIFVINNKGQRIPVSSVAFISPESQGPISIKRENQKRTIHITAQTLKTLTIGKSKKVVKLNDVEAKLRKLVREEIPQQEDLSIDFSGDYADLMEYGLKLMLVLFMAILLVFGVMASQFESLLDPFIILFTIPLTLIGVIWIYYLTFEHMSMLTLVGIIVLAGIVVNNGIVLVDYTNLLVKRGLSIKDACIEAGHHRLRPILMTTLTTVLGLIPTAFIKIQGGDLMRIISKTILGGLTISTIFTLFLIPVIYSIFNEFAEKRKLKHAEKRKLQLEIRKEKLAKKEFKKRSKK